MNTLPSSEFRKTFARLTAPVVVTVRDHPIGTWTPVVVPSILRAVPEPVDTPPVVRPASTAAPRPPTSAQKAQKERDGWLRTING